MSIDKPTKAQPETIEVITAKYAVTSGVFKVRGNVWERSENPKKLVFSLCDADRRKYATTLIFHGDWHVTEAAACDRIKTMVAAKRKGLAKQIEALNQIDSGLTAGKLPAASGEK